MSRLYKESVGKEGYKYLANYVKKSIMSAIEDKDMSIIMKIKLKMAIATFVAAAITKFRKETGSDYGAVCSKLQEMLGPMKQSLKGYDDWKELLYFIKNKTSEISKPKAKIKPQEPSPKAEEVKDVPDIVEIETLQEKTQEEGIPKDPNWASLADTMSGQLDELPKAASLRLSK